MTMKLEIQEVKRIIIRRLLKAYPGGWTAERLRKQVPKRIRRFFPKAMNQLSTDGVLSKKGRKFHFGGLKPAAGANPSIPIKAL